MADINQIIDKKVIDTLKQMNDELVKAGQNIDKLIPPLNGLNEAQKNITKTTKDQTEQEKQLIAQQREAEAINKQILATEAKINALNSESSKILAEQKLKLQQATQAQKDKIKAEQAAEGSLVKMRARLKELVTAYDNAGTRTKAATKEINNLTEQIKKAEAATGRHQRNVGNYTSVWNKFKDTTSLLPGALGNAASSAEGLVTKIASLAPVGGMVAGTIVAAGAQLAAFFTKTEQGAEMLERKWAGMKAAWSVLVGELADGGKKIAESFEDSQKQSSFWTGVLSALSPGLIGLGVRMDLASDAAENYTKQIQLLDDAERGMIVPRAQANQQIKEAMLLYNKEGASIETKLNALRTAIDLENKTADAEIEHQKSVVENIRIINEEKRKAGQLRDEDDRKLQEAMAKEIELSTESMGRQIRATARINAARKELMEPILKEQEARKKLNTDTIKLSEDLVRSKSETDDVINDKIEQSIDWQMSQEDALNQYKIDEAIKTGETIFEEHQKLREKEAEEKKKQEEEEAEIRQAIQDAAFETASMLSDELTNRRIANIEKEFSVLEMQKEAELANANLTASQKQAIEEKYAKKAGELKTKQAKVEKQGAIFSAVISTALAVLNALNTKPFLPLGPIMAGIAGGLGAIQIAAIASRPIPQFAKGTDFAPGGLSLVGEKGRELIQTPDGNVFLANNPALVNLQRGSKVLTNQKTEAYLNDRNIVSELRYGLKSVENAINRKPIAITDNSGRIVGRQSNNYRETYLNRLQNGR